MVDQAPQHLQTRKSPVYWDWWRENPVEIILVIFIIVMFFALPRTGCGITAVDDGAPRAEGPTSTVVQLAAIP
ncbi:MAG: hypothetical protein ACNA8W_13235 [Bradymonadaceae bacterium]